MTASWTVSPGRDTADWYREFASVELAGISPRYEAICLGVAGDADVCGRLDSLPVAKRQPNLLLAAVRYLGGPVDSWHGFRGFAVDRWDDLATTMRERRTQTNEARRCAGLLPVLAVLPQPVALLEVGASAGLCLFPDRYHYRYEPPRSAGPPMAELGSGNPLLRCTVEGAAPLPERLPSVVWRAGLDLNPLDVTSAEDVRWLESLIWPDESDRFDVLRGAVAVAREQPPRIVTGDLATDLEPLAEQVPAEAATLVVFHTAVLSYVEEDGRRAFAAAIDRLSARRPTCWLANEAPGVLRGTAELRDRRRQSFVLCRDRRPVAFTAGHGQFLEWL